MRALLRFLLVQVALWHPLTANSQNTDSLKETRLTVSSETAREREQTAEEDPMARRRSDRVDRVDDWSKLPDELELYASARLRYNLSDGESIWGDGGSRAGLSGQWQFRPKAWLFGRAEAGFNLLDQASALLNPKGRSSNLDDDVFARLAYAGVETPDLIAMVGKNWSTYYQVAGFTDRFEGTGGDASGAFNANTDGGATGTGRADRVLQSRFLIDFFPDNWWVKPFNLNVQMQHGESIPSVAGVDYGTSFGLSAILQLLNDYTVGIAYNEAKVRDTDDQRVRGAGIDGNARALLLGTKWYGDKWYLGIIASWLDNHETTNEGIYFDAWGSELFASYQIADRWWLLGGWNYLKPRSGETQAGAYRINYGVLGLRYTFRDFERMIYAEIRLDDGHNADGSATKNVYSVGLRWDFP